MSVSREEFDMLVARVDRVERTVGATVEMVSAEVVGLRTHLDERFDTVDRRLDTMDGRLDGMNGRLDRLDGQVAEMGVRLGSLESQMSAQTEQVRAYTEQVNKALTLGSDAAARNERFARAIADHFGIGLET